MKLMFRLSVILTLLILLLSSGSPKQSNPAKFVLESMITSVDKHNQYQYIVDTKERIDGELISSSSLFKYQYTPRRIYLKSLESGVEILFGDGLYDGEALINPNGFPYMNLTLDPEGWIMRKDHHHSLDDAGFHFICRVLENAMKRVGDDFDQYFKYKGDTLIEGKNCFHVVIDVFDFEYKSYTVKEGEDILDIADRLWLNDYLIVERNEDVDDFDDVSAGQVIKIPNAYARKISVFVDSKTHFPFIEEIYDMQGLYERYKFREIIPSPNLTEDDFSDENDEYGF